MAKLTGKTAMITGATGGIGEATAKLFLAEGANVMLVGRSAQKLEETRHNRMIRSIEEQLAPANPDAVRQFMLGKIAMGRYGTNEEVAKLVSFLASDEASYCTGASFAIDGGFLAA